MYKVTIILVCFLALISFLIFQTQSAAVISLTVVVIAIAYGIYKSPKEKRAPIIVFLIVAVPLLILIRTYFG